MLPILGTVRHKGHTERDAQKSKAPSPRTELKGLGPWGPCPQPIQLLTLPGTSSPHPHPFQAAIRRGVDARSATSVALRERPHAGGGSALGAGQSTQAGQARADILHSRAVAGTGEGR